MAAMKDLTSMTVSIYRYILPWRVKPVIPLVAETRGGLSHKTRGLVNLCATLAKSNAAPGFNSKLRAELTSKKFMYKIVFAIGLNNEDTHDL